MNYVKYLCLGLFLSGCAQLPEHRKVFRIDNELLPYVKVFEKEASKRGLVIVIDDLVATIKVIEDTEIAGTCETQQTPRIIIDKEYWVNGSDASREQVIFHELGHCILGRGHNDASYSPTPGVRVPASIMSSSTHYEYVYSKYRSYYLDELFLGK